MWAHPGKQLLFMGQEFAQGAEWSEAHGPDWWLLDPVYRAEPDHRGVRDLVRDLNTVYRHEPALWATRHRPRRASPGSPATRPTTTSSPSSATTPTASPLLAVSNFSPVVRHDYRLGVPDDIPAWHEVLNTDAARYGGSDVTNPDPVKPDAQPCPRPRGQHPPHAATAGDGVAAARLAFFAPAAPTHSRPFWGLRPQTPAPQTPEGLNTAQFPAPLET